MSFTTRHPPTILISTDALIGTGAPVYADEVLTPSESGWDILDVTYVHKEANLTAEDIGAIFPLGQQLPSRNFWVVSAKPMRRAPGLWFSKVRYKGWGVSKPAKIVVGTSAEQQQAENITISGVGTFPKVQVNQNTPTVSIIYLISDTATQGVTDQVGEAVSLPVGVSVPAPTNFWNYLSEYVYHFPNGWKLYGSNQDRLPGSPAALVRDSYKYVHDISPG